jgi:hypothetical protein
MIEAKPKVGCLQEEEIGILKEGWLEEDVSLLKEMMVTG